MTTQPAAGSAWTPGMPWYRVRMVWLVVAGPLAVVAASFVTLAVALSHPDPVVGAEAAANAAHTPAVTARNHAASPQR